MWEFLKSKIPHLWSIATRTELWAMAAAILIAIQDSKLIDSDSKLGAVIAAAVYILGRVVRKVGKDVSQAKAMAAVSANMGSAEPPANPT